MKISVVIPAYNAADVIGETLDSVQRQTHAAYEVIVVDDGSTDDTAKVAASHATRPLVLVKSNGGSPSAMNAGVAAAGGDAIAFLDADDLWSPDKLAAQAAALQWAGSDHAVFGHGETFICPSVPADLHANLQFVKGRTPAYLCGSMLVGRPWLAEDGRLDETLLTGYFIEWYRVARERGLKSLMLDQLVHFRRIRPGTLSSRKVRGGDTFSGNIVEIARRALLAKRAASDASR
ncbi:MAG: glycosyltransferase family A protein [Hyphomicrobiales bacterium]